MRLDEFLKTSNYYVCEDNKHYFIGNFNIDYNEINKLYQHFLNTGENLINNYVKLIHLQWEENPFIFEEQKHFLDYSLEMMRKLSVMNVDFYIECRFLIKKGYDNYNKWILKNSGKKRRDAQNFISRKKIREFIFKRDNYRCLCCDSNKKLSIDHIIPVNKNGKNKISNLQTLCKSCNSKKSDKYKDYR